MLTCLNLPPLLIGRWHPVYSMSHWSVVHPTKHKLCLSHLHLPGLEQLWVNRTHSGRNFGACITCMGRGSIFQAQRNSTGENCRWTVDWPYPVELSRRMYKPGAVPGSAGRHRVPSAGATKRLFSHCGPLSHSDHFPSGDLLKIKERRHQCIIKAS